MAPTANRIKHIRALIISSYSESVALFLSLSVKERIESISTKTKIKHPSICHEEMSVGLGRTNWK